MCKINFNKKMRKLQVRTIYLEGPAQSPR
uniref:Uncharacterized protein n=1 Tax=Timema poppense TaxID=170557 RepID=A0A7R9DTZ6_TIMPO|nr:unnamed protein product [Timema poppensis]